MKYELIELLRCPVCKTTFTLTVDRESNGEVETGTLICGDGHKYPVTRFVPRFVDADAYADSFSRQRLYVRRHFEHYRADRSGHALFWTSTGFEPADMAGGLTLEIGCGYGRFVDVVQQAGGRIVGVDLSTHSIDLAQDHVGFRDNAFLVQADLFSLPFETGSFQRIFSLGVLHHTPDTHTAFAAVAPYVKEGGRLSVWVYHPDNKRSADRWRPLTVTLDHRVLYGWCVLNQVLFSWVRALPGGHRFNRLVPGASPGPGRPFWLRVLGDFDNLSPVFAHTHTPEEVAAWFSDAGFADVVALPRLTAITARRADHVASRKR